MNFSIPAAAIHPRRLPRGIRIGLVVGLPLLLGGCFPPSPVSMATLALDGVSYLTTQKSLTDHGLSLLAGKDCALHRTLTGKDICKDKEIDLDDVDIMVAAAPGAEPIAVTVSAPPATFVDDWEVAVRPASADPNENGPVPAWARKVAADRGGQLFYVLGSFNDSDNARHLMALCSDLSPTLLEVSIEQRQVYQVVVGPVPPTRHQAMGNRIAAAGFYDAWAFRTRPSDHPAPVETARNPAASTTY